MTLTVEACPVCAAPTEKHCTSHTCVWWSCTKNPDHYGHLYDGRVVEHR